MKPFQVSCPNCNKGFMVKNPDAVGKNFRCTQCQTVFVIQPPATLSEEEEEVPLPQAVGATGPGAGHGAAHGRPAAAAPGAGSDRADDEEEEEGEDYPDNEPTIAVSAYEAQKLREQLRKNLNTGSTPEIQPTSAGFAGSPPSGVANRPGARPGQMPGQMPGLGQMGQPGMNPANTAQPSGGGSNTLLFVVIGLAVVVVVLVVVLFVAT